MTDLGFKVWAAGTVVLAAMTACADNSADPAEPTTPTAVTSTPTAPSTAPSSMSPTDEAAARATATVHRYFAVLDDVRQDDSIPIARLASAMTSVELGAERRLIAHEREQGLRQVGRTSVAQLKVQSVNLDDSDPSAGKVPTVTVDVCWDVSNADLVDKNGQSVVSPSRADRGWTRYTVANYHWSANPTGGWRVANGQDLKQTPCAA
jgi:hypothetical protein